jgi:hypothetical protein
MTKMTVDNAEEGYCSPRPQPAATENMTNTRRGAKPPAPFFEHVMREGDEWQAAKILDLIETIDQEMVIGSRIAVDLTESVTIRLT